MSITTEAPATLRVVTHSFPLANAITAASAVLPHISKDDVAAVITAAQVTHEHWLATDRYTVGRFAITRPTEGPLAVEKSSDDAILLPREAVEWVSKIVASKLRHNRGGSVGDLYSVDVSQEWLEPRYAGGDPVAGDVAVAIVFSGKVERSQSFDPTVGNFPPVERLIADWKPAEEIAVQMVDPARLEKVTTFAKRHRKEAPIHLEAGKGYGDKPGPMRVTFDALTVLIQPHLPLR